ncbi:MAG TPA: bifunctional riboflavin kinase/FAD synthetase [Acidimicrobiales bacterium]|jgi:riboflavin kinase/FMN adenylyltransferase|nr:bifunctional riboflavin kinase/FAD synthetase [Acidimicrobiales bacterium]
MIVRYDGEPDTSSKPSVVAVGVFDGLHRGHQAVLQQLVELARSYDALATVVTFDPPPASVLAPERAPRLLETIEQRLEGFERLSVDQVRVLTFSNELARETATEFIDRVLVNDLRARCIIVGEDFHFGHNREGTLAVLRAAGDELGFDVVAAPTYGDDERWSSTSVRRALTDGELDRAASILGHPFTLRGAVVHGDERGQELGFPTANLQLSDRQALPAEGVYAGALELEGEWWPAAISVGRRPQFYDDGDLLVEVHLIDYRGDLYDRVLDVVFIEWLRGQTTFASEVELSEQIGLDVAKTQQLFTEFSKKASKLLR